VKRYWEIIADNLKKAGWSVGWVSALDSEGRTGGVVVAPKRRGWISFQLARWVFDLCIATKFLKNSGRSLRIYIEPPSSVGAGRTFDVVARRRI
jgi:hypothetical protein